MSRPIIPKIIDDDYAVDIISDGNKFVPPAVMLNLRHLLVACECGDLVVVECTKRDGGGTAYVLCAYLSNESNTILPICEIENGNALTARMRPPADVGEIRFAKPITPDESEQVH